MKMQQASDSELARKARQKNAAAWREIIRRHNALVYRLCLRMLKSQAEAEDASQEAFLRMYRSIESFDPTRPLKPWISRIAYNVCLRRFEQAAKKPLPARDQQVVQNSLASSDKSPEAQASQAETEAMLENALDTLSSQDRALLNMRYREGLSDAEVAEATSMPVGTVKTRIFRARSKLRQTLEPLMEAPQ